MKHVEEYKPKIQLAAIADNNVLALNAPSGTFDLNTKSYKNSFYKPIVKVAAGCNNFHDALGSSFHSGDRGVNIVVCRLCHNTKSGSSHLEMESRSIDSYAHAIHSFQALDIQGYDFTDPVETMYYELKVNSNFPTFGISNCESCHDKGMFNVPDRSKSLPGVLSASRDTIVGWNRKIDRQCGELCRRSWFKGLRCMSQGRKDQGR
jgi:hypothetical protein